MIFEACWLSWTRFETPEAGRCSGVRGNANAPLATGINTNPAQASWHGAAALAESRGVNKAPAGTGMGQIANGNRRAGAVPAMVCWHASRPRVRSSPRGATRACRPSGPVRPRSALPLAHLPEPGVQAPGPSSGRAWAMARADARIRSRSEPEVRALAGVPAAPRVHLTPSVASTRAGWAESCHRNGRTPGPRRPCAHHPAPPARSVAG